VERIPIKRLNIPDALRLATESLRAGQLGRAEALCRSILRHQPDNFDALHLLGFIEARRGRYVEAIAKYDRAIAIRPNHVQALNERGNALGAAGRFEAALEDYRKVLSAKPNHIPALLKRAVVLHINLKRFDDALADYDRVLSIRGDDLEALGGRVGVLRQLGRLEEAMQSCELGLAVRFSDLAYNSLAEMAQRTCDWSRTRKLTDEIKGHLVESKVIVRPIMLLAYFDDAALHARYATRFVGALHPSLPQPLRRDGARYSHDKIRLAYLSSDFGSHPVSYLIARLFEIHDRSRFEVIGISYGLNDDGSEMRARVVKAFDQFHDVSERSDLEAAKLLRAREVDIAIDLNGLTGGARTGILAHRPAPIQVNYLGYPGTMGASFVDYVIADRIVLPFDRRPFYEEKIVHLPDCYQPNDSLHRSADCTTTRTTVGLPVRGFVFCCFNHPSKIVAPIFEAWMRVLAQVEGSVLWLLNDTGSATANLRREAAARGIDPQRLIFADPVPHDSHIGRIGLADLFLDTLPYNAHTTASDALWAGLPVLTCMGSAFAGRVAASLLNSVALPELVTSTIDDYAALAVRLARDPRLLQEMRVKLNENRRTSPLFDTERFRMGIESAYTTMWTIWQSGDSPRSFAVGEPAFAS
jgi:protein O-GlcNAc transferase